MGSLGQLEVFIIMFVVLITLLVPALLCWRICSKAGLPGIWGLLALIPGWGILIPLIVLAVSEWPIERELRDARQGNYA